MYRCIPSVQYRVLSIFAVQSITSCDFFVDDCNPEDDSCSVEVNYNFGVCTVIML